MDAGLSTWEDEGGAIPSQEGSAQESDSQSDELSAPESHSAPGTAMRAAKGKS